MMELTAFEDNQIEITQLHYKNYKTFSGAVSFYELNGQLANGWHYKEGKNIASTSKRIDKLKLLAGTNKMGANGKVMLAQVACGTISVAHWSQQCTVGVSDGSGWGYDPNSSTTCNWVVSYTEETVYCSDGGGDGGYPPGGGGGGSSFDPENPTDDEYTLTVIADSINVSKRFECFDNLPTNASTVYSVKICADVPNNAKPNDLMSGGNVGHAFLELTKTTGSTSVTQTIGFYPANYHTAKLQVNVASMVVDNDGHDYDASLIKMLNVVQFNAMLAATLPAAAHQYNMGSYNCTNFALDIFNSQGSTIFIPDRQAIAWNYGKTPNALYNKIVDLYNNQGPGASPFSGTGALSTECN